MTCPKCKCPDCRRQELQAVLVRRIVSRETVSDAELRAAFDLMPKYTLRREPVAEMEG